MTTASNNFNDLIFVMTDSFQTISAMTYQKMMSHLELEPQKHESLEKAIEWIEFQFQMTENFLSAKFKYHKPKTILNAVTNPLELLNQSFYPAMEEYPFNWCDQHHERLYMNCLFTLSKCGREAVYDKLCAEGLIRAVESYRERALIRGTPATHHYVLGEMESASLESSTPKKLRGLVRMRM